MIDGSYKMKIDVPFGPKDGKVKLRTEGDTLFADIDAPVVGKQRLKGKAEGDTFSAAGSGWILLLGKIDYALVGQVSGDTLQIEIQSNKGNIKLEGVREPA